MTYTAHIQFTASNHETAKQLFELMREAFCNQDANSGIKELTATLTDAEFNLHTHSIRSN